MSIIGLTAGAPAQTPAAAPGAGAAGGASPYTIQGGLNFGAAPEGPFGGDIQGSYTSAYNNALSLNQQNYANILSGYQQTAGNLAGTTQGSYGVLAAAGQESTGGHNKGIQQGVRSAASGRMSRTRFRASEPRSPKQSPTHTAL